MASENERPLVKYFAQFRVNETFFIWGGWKETGISNKLWEFDFSSQKWKEVNEGNKTPEARHSMAYATDGNKLYIFGGISTSGLLNDLWEFDVQAKQWRELKINSGGIGPEPCSGAGMLVSNGSAIVFGGDTGSNITTKLKMFRAKIDNTYPVWEEVKFSEKDEDGSDIPDSRSNFGYATFLNEREAYIYIFGGRVSNNIFNESDSLLILDCRSVIGSYDKYNTVRFKEIKFDDDHPFQRTDCGCAVDKEGNLFVFGGRGLGYINADLIKVKKDFLSLNVSNKKAYSEETVGKKSKFGKRILNSNNETSFSNTEGEYYSFHKKNLKFPSNESEDPFETLIHVFDYAPTPRVNSIVGYMKESFFVFGGRDPSTGEIFNDFYIISLTDGEWRRVVPREKSETPPARELASYCFDKGRLLIFGGLGPNPQTGKIEPSNELWEFSFFTETWKQLGKNSIQKPTPVYGSAITIFENVLLFIGGRTAYGLDYTVCDGKSLPFDNKVLMFGGRIGNRAMDTFKIVEFDGDGNASLIEDNGTFLSDGSHLDVVEAGCTVFNKSVYCFGGRQTSEGGTIMPTAFDTFRKIAISDEFITCSPGSYKKKEDCDFCPEGTYSNDYGSTNCTPCPPGTYSVWRGAQGFECQIVKAGCFSDAPGLKRQKYCDKEQYCPIGLTVIGAILALILLCLPSKKYMWMLDGYSNKYVDSLDPQTHKTTKQIKKTTFGGFVSIIGLFFVFGASLSTIFGYAMFGIEETKTTADASIEEKANFKNISNKMFLVNITLINYSGKCVDSSDNSSNVSGECSPNLGLGKTMYDPVNSYDSNGNTQLLFNPVCSQSESINTFYPETRDCTIKIDASFKSFVVDNSFAHFFSMFSSEREATCRAIKVYASLDSAIPEQNKTHPLKFTPYNYKSSIEEIVVADETSVFSGYRSTNVTLELKNSIYRRNITFKAYDQKNGHLINHISFDKGSTTNEYDFYNSMGFGMNIILKLDNNVVITQHSMKITWVMFFSSLGGTLVYFGYFGNVMPVFEMLINVNWPCGRKVQKKVTTVFHDSANKTKRKDTNKEYMKELETMLDEQLSSNLL
eukprot:MONOS_7516.1-p1 / transcript=MONOS_7516.1 / gene=MONOS_7516 / organism=Monocercomonoides_exilis_PA203 / gene_product=unspecified product / transcript_product=unspecified product / location=Mono_scaffold00258:62253-66093(-) / protein_length=1078 / sequence_SO=supercontig / SO=protein_coding / is_pseudo=false